MPENSVYHNEAVHSENIQFWFTLRNIRIPKDTDFRGKQFLRRTGIVPTKNFLSGTVKSIQKPQKIPEGYSFSRIPKQ